MKSMRRILILGVAAIAATAITGAAVAQGRAGGYGQGGSGGRGQGQGQAQGRGQGQAQRGGGAQNQQRAEKQKEIRERLRDRDIYGREMMTAEERERYRERVDAAATDREWAQIREQHMNEMRARAQSQGRRLDPPVYGQNMLTAREQRQYQRRLERAVNDIERERIRAEHRDMIRERAQALGLPLPAEQS